MVSERTAIKEIKAKYPEFFQDYRYRRQRRSDWGRLPDDMLAMHIKVIKLPRRRWHPDNEFQYRGN